MQITENLHKRLNRITEDATRNKKNSNEDKDGVRRISSTVKIYAKMDTLGDPLKPPEWSSTQRNCKMLKTEDTCSS